jgi:CBS domain-containing protein
MLRLRDIMTTELVTVSPDLSLRDTMELFVREHVSGAPVLAQREVVGVVSVTDLLAFAATLQEEDLNPGREDADWGEESSVSRAGGVDEAAATWFVQAGADEVPEFIERFTEAEMRRTERDRFGEHTVSEVMTSDVRSLPGHTPVDQAADFMRQAGIHRVLVMSDGELEGIVSMKDIADAVADHKLTARTYVFGANISYQGRPPHDRRA